MMPILKDFVNFNPIPFNLPWALPRSYFALLDWFNGSYRLRKGLPWLYATSLVALRKDEGGAR